MASLEKLHNKWTFYNFVQSAEALVGPAAAASLRCPRTVAFDSALPRPAGRVVIKDAHSRGGMSHTVWEPGAAWPPAGINQNHIVQVTGR